MVAKLSIGVNVALVKTNTDRSGWKQKRWSPSRTPPISRRLLDRSRERKSLDEEGVSVC